MKRIRFLALVLAALMLLSLCACGGTEKAPETDFVID